MVIGDRNEERRLSVCLAAPRTDPPSTVHLDPRVKAEQAPRGLAKTDDRDEIGEVLMVSAVLHPTPRVTCVQPAGRRPHHDDEAVTGDDGSHGKQARRDAGTCQ